MVENLWLSPGQADSQVFCYWATVRVVGGILTSQKLLVCGLGLLCVIKEQVEYFCLANEVNVKLEFPGQSILMSHETFPQHMLVHF